MVFRVFIIVIIMFSKFSFANIIYDKNNIIITELEIINYQNLYQQQNGERLQKNKALKDLILIKKTISSLLINHPRFILNLDEKIKLQFGKKVFEDNLLKDFLRFKMIRNDFISDYFKKKFTIEQLDLAFSNIKELKLPISQNNCLTIDKMLDLKKDKIFLNSLIENIKSNQNNYKTILNGNT